MQNVLLLCLNVLRSVSPGELPSLQQLGFDAATLQRCANDKSAAGARLRGGESEAMRRLSDFTTHFTHPGSANSSSRSGGESSAVTAGAPNFCCKISPWLALGCLSPRQLYEQLQQKLAGQQQQLRAAGQGSDTGESSSDVCGGIMVALRQALHVSHM
jgi:deoxyribodipyrimidine photolyase